MDVLIRHALDHDLGPAGDLCVEVFVGDGYSLPDGSYAGLLRDTARRRAEAELLVAVDAGDDRVLGCVTFAPGGTGWADIARPDEGEIRMLAVGRHARGRGVGSALVSASMERSRALGLAGMAFSTRPEMTDAHRVYERLGFARTPDRDWEPMPGRRLMVYALAF